jgi:hypothetical protein
VEVMGHSMYNDSSHVAKVMLLAHSTPALKFMSALTYTLRLVGRTAEV